MHAVCEQSQVFPPLANYCDNFKLLFGLVSGYKLATHGIKMYNSTSRGNYFKGIFGSLENNKSFGTWKKVGTV